MNVRIIIPDHVAQVTTQGLRLNVPTIFSPGVTALLQPTGDEIPIPEEALGPPERLTSFTFGSPATGNRLDPYNPISATPYRGMLLLVDGMSRNSDWDGDNIRNLEIIAPKAAPTVAAGSAQSGSTGTVKYVYRYRNEKNDKRSGISEESAEINVTNQFVNVTLVASTDPQVTHIQVYRSLNNAYNAFYLVAEVGNTNQTIQDDLGNPTEFDIQRNERSYLIGGNTYEIGPIPPVLKARENSGFVYYFGLQRMPNYSSGVVSGSADSRELTVSGGGRVRWSRLQQKVKIDGDGTDYRIVDLDIANEKMIVDPPLKAAASNASYYIEDNRDGRVCYISDAGRSGSIPQIHNLTFGADIDDVLMEMFQLGQNSYIISNDNIYFLEGQRDIEPWFQLGVKRSIPEGQVGPNAGLYIPDLGYVFVDKTLGPRVFDGTATNALSGSRGESELIREWLRFNASRLWYTHVTYNARKKHILISFARDNDETPQSTLVFSLRDMQWTGPWVRKSFRTGRLLDRVGGSHPIIGTDLGTIYQDYVGQRDGVASGTVEGIITGVAGNRITDSGARFFDTGIGLFSCSVEITSPFGVSYQYYISNNGQNYFDILGKMDPVPQVGWRYSICSIPWRITTGYLDLGEPDRIKELEKVSLRFAYGKYGRVRGAFAVDGRNFYVSHSGQEEVSGQVQARFRVDRRGTTFQMDLAGSGESESLEISEAIGVMRLYRSLEP